jgi:hypothetical protein
MFRRTITRGRRQYRFEVNLDDAAIMEDSLAIDIEASTRELSGETWSEWYPIKLRVEVRTAEEQAVLLYEDRVVGRISLRTDVPENDNFDGDGMDVEAEDAALAPALSEFDWAEAIDAIPAVDPVFGCLIRGAASTVIGQAIRCWKQVGVQDELRDRTWKVLGCLRESGTKMAFTFVCRAGMCMVKGGF